MLDLFGADTAPAKRTNYRPEAAALVEVLKALRTHPAVAWWSARTAGLLRSRLSLRLPLICVF